MVENLTSDLSENKVGPNLKVVDGNNKVPVVHVKTRYVAHCGVGTDDNKITQSKTADNNVLKESGIYRLAKIVHKLSKLIVLIIIMTSMFIPQRLIRSNGSDVDTLNFDNAILKHTLKYLKPRLSMASTMPDWLKSHWNPVPLCTDGSNLQTHCCCGQCLWFCIKPINDRTNEKFLSRFCDCQQASSVMDSLNRNSNHRLIKGLAWLDEIFEEYSTSGNSLLKRGISVLSYLLVIIFTVMVLFKLFCLKLTNKSYSYNLNVDSSNINTQNTTHTNSIAVHAVPKQLPTRQVLSKQCTDERLKQSRFAIKINKSVKDIVKEKNALTDKTPVTENQNSNPQNAFKRYGYRRWY